MYIIINRWGQELELYIMTISRLRAFTTAKYKFSPTLTEGKLVVPPANLKFRITIKLQVARARATTTVTVTEVLTVVILTRTRRSQVT